MSVDLRDLEALASEYERLDSRMFAALYVAARDATPPELAEALREALHLMPGNGPLRVRQAITRAVTPYTLRESGAA